MSKVPKLITLVVALIGLLSPLDAAHAAHAAPANQGDPGGSSPPCAAMPTTPRLVNGYITGTVTLTCQINHQVLYVEPVIVNSAGTPYYQSGTHDHSCTGTYTCSMTIRVPKPSGTHTYYLWSELAGTKVADFGAPSGGAYDCNTSYIWCPKSSTATF